MQLSDKVRVNDGVLSTTELSQGQRKRLALLTAYLEDRPIYVFNDQWAADQDPYFREVFYYQILPSLRFRGKTVVTEIATMIAITTLEIRTSSSSIAEWLNTMVQCPRFRAVLEGACRRTMNPPRRNGD